MCHFLATQLTKIWSVDNISINLHNERIYVKVLQIHCLYQVHYLSANDSKLEKDAAAENKIFKLFSLHFKKKMFKYIIIRFRKHGTYQTRESYHHWLASKITSCYCFLCKDIYKLVSLIKKKIYPCTLPSGVVDTFTFFMESSSSQRTSLTSISIIKTFSYFFNPWIIHKKLYQTNQNILSRKDGKIKGRRWRKDAILAQLASGRHIYIYIYINYYLLDQQMLIIR